MPAAPSGAQNDPGRTVGWPTTVVVAPPDAPDAAVVAVTARVVEVATVVEVAIVVAVEIVVAVTARVVVGATVVCGACVVVTTVTPPGAGVYPRTVVPAHWPSSKFFSRPHSLSSIERFQRAFTEIQFET